MNIDIKMTRRSRWTLWLCASVMLVQAVSVQAVSVTGSTTYRPAHPWTLWYRVPADSHGSSNAWMDYYLPLGNGHIGAMVAGGVAHDVVQLSENTFWKGSSTELGAYQNLGYLRIDDTDGESDVSDYHFALDLTTAVAETAWQRKDGVSVRREYLCNWPHRCMVVHEEASGAAVLNRGVRLEGTHGETVSYAKGQITMQSPMQTVTACTMATVLTDDGAEVSTTDDAIIVENATELTIILVVLTDYDAGAATYVSGTDRLLKRATTLLQDALHQGWTRLRAEHESDYEALFSRSAFVLNDAEADLPTDELVLNAINTPPTAS